MSQNALPQENLKRENLPDYIRKIVHHAAIMLDGHDHEETLIFTYVDACLWFDRFTDEYRGLGYSQAYAILMQEFCPYQITYNALLDYEEFTSVAKEVNCRGIIGYQFQGFGGTILYFSDSTAAVYFKMHYS